jgi:hypothetical protein
MTPPISHGLAIPGRQAIRAVGALSGPSASIASQFRSSYLSRRGMVAYPLRGYQRHQRNLNWRDRRTIVIPKSIALTLL